MSSILKALKRLEDRDSKQKAAHSWQQKTDTREAVNMRVKGDWLFSKIVSILVIVVILVGGGWFFLKYKPFFAEKYNSDKAQLSKENTAVSDKHGTELPAKIRAETAKSVIFREKTGSAPMLSQKKAADLRDNEKFERIQKKTPVAEIKTQPATSLNIPKKMTGKNLNKSGKNHLR